MFDRRRAAADKANGLTRFNVLRGKTSYTKLRLKLIIESPEFVRGKSAELILQAKAQNKILIVDDERYVRAALAEALRAWNYATLEAATIADARRLLAEAEPAAILLDIDLPDGSGLDLLPEIKEQAPETVVVLITAYVNVNNTIAALRGGAWDFIGKPVKLEELRVTVRNGLETRALRREVGRTRRESDKKFGFDQIVGESVALGKAKELARRAAQSDVSAILLQGETGTGKDLFARAIHYASDRRDAAFVAINCAALPANLIESELFGHERGAFTDARTRKEGLFEQAQGGTIFLDEIGEMNLALQAKLLRVLEENRFRRVGGLKELRLDARIIAASNRNLKAECEIGNFRRDLFYRLSIIEIEIPPLRARGSDALILANHFIERANWRRAAKLRGLAPEVARIFEHYKWIGNVRELRNVIERAAILEDNDFITTEHLPADLLAETAANQTNGENAIVVLPPEGVALDRVELELARQAMRRANGNLTRAARLLHISRDQLRYKLKKSASDDFGSQNRER